MRSVRVVVLDVLVEELFELSVVPDARPVRAGTSNRSRETAFRR
jgi:hypothetical protein